MSRNIVVCCDGTANEFAKDNTNVVKLYSVLEHDPGHQVAYYHPGLGTMEAAGALTPLARKITKLLGMAIGYGLASDIRDAYVFLMRHFREGDRVFLFGFSRGAYTARAVASLLHLYGLVQPGNESLVPYVIRMMMSIRRASGSERQRTAAMNDYLGLARDFRDAMACVPCRPWFVGVWDTVSSVGWIANPLKLPYVTSNPSIQIGRHAIAIDERRAFFRNHLWRPPSDATPQGPKDVKQVWFPGVHCDVGGGYPEPQSGLAKVALRWMLTEARAAGLLIDAGKYRHVLGDDGGPYVKPDALADPHESLTGAWHLAEFLPKKHFDWESRKETRRMNLYRRRTIPPNSQVHVAAKQRGAEYCKRLPDDVEWVDDLALDADRGLPAKAA
ncbi:MAG TPA: DUF2235 domain-containing protein [Casimicrobiaceae bacterium]